MSQLSVIVHKYLCCSTNRFFQNLKTAVEKEENEPVLKQSKNASCSEKCSKLQQRTKIKSGDSETGDLEEGDLFLFDECTMDLETGIFDTMYSGDG